MCVVDPVNYSKIAEDQGKYQVEMTREGSSLPWVIITVTGATAMHLCPCIILEKEQLYGIKRVVFIFISFIPGNFHSHNNHAVPHHPQHQQGCCHPGPGPLEDIFLNTFRYSDA